MKFRVYDLALIDRMNELGLAIPAEDIDDFELTEDEQLIVFRNQFMTCKKDVMKKIMDIRNNLKKNIFFGQSRNEAYCKTLDDMYEKLYREVSFSMLFDAPQGFWHYEIEQDSMGIRLRIQNAGGEIDSDLNYNIDAINDEYTMMRVDARLLTIEEYAKLYDVQAVTVRQWIRRGKIRTAVKYGNEWRIPELADIPNKERGYHKAVYFWNKKIKAVPENYEFINDYEYLVITQDELDKNKYLLEFKSSTTVNEKTIHCSKEERERFELSLISNSDVNYRETVYAID